MKKFLFLFCFALSSGMAQAHKFTLPDIAVADTGQHIVINIPQLRLFFFEDGVLQKSYPIAVGKNRTQTPLGEFQIGVKAFNPTWTIPRSIRKERAAAGLPDIASIPPGPNNPLGPVFVRFGNPKDGYGIHGTNAPSSVPGVRSHGCVRMKSPDALEFAKAVARDSRLSVVYQRYALNQDESGHLWLAVYADPYKIQNNARAQLQAALEDWALQHGRVPDQARIQKALKQGARTPVCLTCAHKPSAKTPLATLAWTDASAVPRALHIVPLPEIAYTLQSGQYLFTPLPEGGYAVSAP